MTDNSFFEKSRNPSLTKAEIVVKYFGAWTKIMIPRVNQQRGNLAYVDLYSGPGYYKDGSQSTPLLVLKKAIDNPDIRELLVTIFNDRDLKTTQLLQQAINALPNIDSLKNKPKILNREVDRGIVQTLKQFRLGPTLYFLDPWGYKGLSPALIGSLIKPWGCDCIFFFNYNRINMGVNNPIAEPNISFFLVISS